MPEPSTPTRRVATASAWVTVGMLAGRLAGILREFLIADTFGVTREADVAILLVTGPEMLVTIAGTGAVGLVLIPILLEHDVGTQLRLIRRLTARLGAAGVVVALAAAALVLAFATDWATASSLSTTSFRTAVFVTALAVPGSMVVVLTAAFLRAQDRFAAVSFSTITFTFPVLAAVVALRSVEGVAVGVAAGAALRYGVQVGIISRMQRWAGAADVRLKFGPADLTASFLISVMVAAQVTVPLLLAAVLGDEGDVALLNYGWRILLIPISLLGSVFSVAAYPSVVRLLQGTAGPPQRAIAAIVRPTILLSILVGIWLWVNAPAAISAVYRPTGLGDLALDQVASGVRAGSLSVPLITIGTAATTVLFGLKRSWAGLVPYLLATPALIVAGAVLSERLGPEGLMYAISAYSAVLCVSAVGVALGTAGFAILGRADAVAAVLTTVGGGATAWAAREVFPGSSFLDVTLNGLAFMAVCGGSYVAVRHVRR